VGRRRSAAVSETPDPTPLRPGDPDELAPFEPETPPPPPEPVRPRPASVPVPVVFEPVTIEDIDILWDWVRQDADKGASFLGTPLGHSVQLHTQVRALVEAEKVGTGCIRAVYRQTELVGFLAVAPVQPEESLAVWRLYLAPKDRVRLLQTALGPILHALRALLPGYRLAAMPTLDLGARLLALGAEAHTLYLLRE